MTLWRLVPKRMRFKLVRRLQRRYPDASREDLESWAEDPDRYHSLREALTMRATLDQGRAVGADGDGGDDA